MTEKIPDSISFTELKKLHADKSTEIDFSSPKLSSDIGDLAFLFTIFTEEKLSGTYTHQQAFLADIVVTRLREVHEKKLSELIDADAPKDEIRFAARMASSLSIVEGVLDSILHAYFKQLGSTSTLPSYKLINSLDPSVRPHEIEQWIRDRNGPSKH